LIGQPIPTTSTVEETPRSHRVRAPQDLKKRYSCSSAQDPKADNDSSKACLSGRRCKLPVRRAELELRGVRYDHTKRMDADVFELKIAISEG